MRTYLDDTEGRTIQGFAPRSIENETITASGVYTLDTTSLVAVQFYASAESQYILKTTNIDTSNGSVNSMSDLIELY